MSLKNTLNMCPVVKYTAYKQYLGFNKKKENKLGDREK